MADFKQSLLEGMVIPACPLALNQDRRWDQRRQRALFRYYAAAGAGGLAVGVHTTQFAIRDPKIGLFQPLLQLAAEELRRADLNRPQPLVRVAGICGATHQAVQEARLIREAGFDCGLLSLSAFPTADEDTLISHCRTVAEILPLFGFYLQPAAGGRLLGESFWRRFAEIPQVTAIKIAPFNRYQTLDVLRAVAASGREDIALYTGNDDNIVMDLLTPFRFLRDGNPVEQRIVGGLLGQWAVGTRQAVGLREQCRAISNSGQAIPSDLIRLNAELTDFNAALFDAAHGFAGCIAGVHEILRRQGLLEGIWCLNQEETLSPGQAEALDRVCRAYPHLMDDDFVQEHLAEWLKE